MGFMTNLLASFVHATVGELKLLHQELIEISLAKMWHMHISVQNQCDELSGTDASNIYFFCLRDLNLKSDMLIEMVSVGSSADVCGNFCCS